MKSIPGKNKKNEADGPSLFERLSNYDSSMLPMHMPGHKRNTSLSGNHGYLEELCAGCDITEIAGFDNLAAPEDILLSSMQRAAALFQSEHTKYLVNGSTGGILSAIYTAVPEGGKVIVARNCHKSVYNGLMLRNAEPCFLYPKVDEKTGIAGPVTLSMVQKAFLECPNPKLLILTSPTYEGIVSDVRSICHFAHKQGVPVLVDSAHGAHFLVESFPESAVTCGADLVVQSLHKTLPSLTQTAVLHLNGNRIPYQKLCQAINLFQTSSPSYLLLASIDGCVRLLEKQGDKLFSEWLDAIHTLEEEIKGLRILSLLFHEGSKEDRFFAYDQSKFVISTARAGISGVELSSILRTEYHIEIEMAAEHYIIAMTGLGDTKESLARFAAALLALDQRLVQKKEQQAMEKVTSPLINETEEPRFISCLQKAERVLSFREASQSEKKELPLLKAFGHTAAEAMYIYPPGIPLFLPGEKITKEAAEYLIRQGENGLSVQRSEGVGKTGVYVVTE